jgi:hypothetical protein
MAKFEFDFDGDLTPNQVDVHYAAAILAVASQPDSQASMVETLVLAALKDHGRPGQLVLQIIGQLAQLAVTDDGQSAFYRPEITNMFQELAVKTTPPENKEPNDG